MQRITLAIGVIGMLAVGGCSGPDEATVISALTRHDLSRLRALAAAPQADEIRTDAVDGTLTWLAVTERIAEYEEASETSGSAESPAVDELTPWRQRRGPAYPGDIWRSLGRDLQELPATVWDDTVATVKNPISLGLLAAAGVTGLALNGPRGNDQVQRHFERHGSQLNTFWDTVGDVGGNPGLHFAIAGAMYFGGLATKHSKTYEVSKTLINALAINGVVTLGLKAAAGTESPNGDEFGWPSGHTSSTFCFATVMHHEYGPWVGVPLFAFAGFVGYERIDARNHDFNDVISGALIGIAIGHAVAKNHEWKVFGMDVIPYTDPTRGGVGVALMKQW